MRVVTIIGPSQSGKTTLVDALSHLDGRPVVTELTEFMSIRKFDYLGEPWCAIDIAGGMDHLGYAGQALAASDAAVLCVPPNPDAAVLSAPYLRLIEASGTPCVLFINRMDMADGRVRDIVASLQAYARHPLIIRQIPIRDESGVVGAVDLISERAWQYQEGKPSALVEMPEDAMPREQEARSELLEHLSDFDDALLEQLIEDKQPGTDDVYSIATEVLQGNKIIPAFLGAASHANGITRLMKSLRHEAPGPEATLARLGTAAAAIGVFADLRKHMGKMTMLRALGGEVRAGKALGGDTVGSLTDVDGKSSVDAIAPGEVCFAVKSDHLDAGRLYSEKDSQPLPDWSRGHPPAYPRILTPVHERDDARLSSALTRLAEIDPGLEIGHDEVTGHSVMKMQGPMHLRRLLAKLNADFGIEAEDHPLPASYRETISKPVDKHYRHRKQTGGAGQFADVHMTVKPLPRGTGFAFDETVKGGAVPRNYIPAVSAGAEDALAEGPLGFRVIDVGVTLTDGKHHSVDSSDHAFRTAGKNGVREALQEASPVLLQPIEHVDIHLPTVFSGAMVTLINSLKGQVLGFENNPDAPGWDVFHALLPASSQEELFRSLGGATQGTAWYEVGFDHYEEVYGKEAEKVSQAKVEARA